MIAVVRSHLSGGSKLGVVKGFDGRRRFDMHITYMGPATRTVGDTRHETYRVRIDPQPVAGFKNVIKCCGTMRRMTFTSAATASFYLYRSCR